MKGVIIVLICFVLSITVCGAIGPGTNTQNLSHGLGYNSDEAIFLI